MSINSNPTENDQFDGLIQQIKASDFFPTQPELMSSLSFFPEIMMSTKGEKHSRRRFSNNFELQSFNSTSTFQNIQPITKDFGLQKVRYCKQKLKQAKSIFLNELQFTHRKHSHYENLQHQTSILKHRFKQLHETKKHRYDSDQIYLRGKIRRQDSIRQSMENTQEKKNQRQESLLFVKKSQEQFRQQLQRKASLEKQQLKMKLNLKINQEKQWKLEKAKQVINSANKFQIRQNQYKRVRTMKSSFNRSLKVNEEKSLIQQYQSILRKLQRNNPELFDQSYEGFYSSRASANRRSSPTGNTPNSLYFADD